MNMRTIIAASVIAALSGCGATDYIEHRDAANQTLDTIQQSAHKEKTTKSIYVSRPPMVANDGIDASSPLWLRKDVSVKGNKLPLSFILRNLLQSGDQSIAVEYGPDVNANKAVSVDYSGNIDGALKEIAAKGDFSIVVTGSKIHVERYVTRIFELNSLLGKSSFLFGNKSSSGGGGNSGEGLATRTVTSQLGNSDSYSNVEGTEIDPFKDYLDAISAILRKSGAEKDDPLEGEVTVTPSTAAIMVRTTPSRMNLVERYVTAQKESVSRQVMIEVKVLQFKGSKGSEFGIDWNVVRAISDGQLNFTGSSLPSIGDGADYGFSFTSTHPLWDGSTVLMKALQTQGHVGVEYEPRTAVRNNRVATIDNSEKLTYIARVIVTPNENGDPSVEVEDAVVSDGLIMSVLPNISDGIVNLQISGLLSKVVAWEDTEVSGVKIRAPQVQEIKFNQDVGLRFGETLVLNGYKQKSNRSDQTSFLKVGLLGGNAGVNATTETIVLITPKRI